MKRTRKILLFLSLAMLGFGCSNSVSNASSGVDKVKESKFYNQYPEFNLSELSSQFQTEVTNDKLLNPLYITASYNLIWVKDTLNTSKIAELVKVLSDVDKHGISKQIFPTEEIISKVKAIDAGFYVNDMTALYKELIELEELASTSAIKYSLGMRFGFLNPKELYGKNYAIVIDRVNEEYYATLYNNLNEDAIKTMLDSQPNDLQYLSLLNEYQKLNTLQDIGISQVPSKGKATYKLMDRGEDVSKIARRLKMTGEYVLPDSVTLNAEGFILDGDLMTAVNEFRVRNSYFEEKEIGDFTIQALNRPMSYYREKVKINLERYRWRRAKEKHTKHIEVNVASQLLWTTENNKQGIEMRVAVGSVKNKTPLLESDISYINLNPVWNVPSSIATKELSVKQKGDRSYFTKNKMKVYKEGREIDIESVDWSSVDTENFGYSIKQTAGDHNALGKMKFMFNNNFSVYLHDTPSKAAFNKQNRAVSHGCIRLQRPVDLALFLTNPNDSSFADRLYYTIDMKVPSAEGRKLQAEKKLKKLDDIIRMKEDVSLFIDYYTVYFKPEDKLLYYADDVYGYDKSILDGLAKLEGKPLIQPTKTMLAQNKKGG